MERLPIDTGKCVAANGRAVTTTWNRCLLLHYCCDVQIS
jgi:hypothetical protein